MTKHKSNNGKSNNGKSLVRQERTLLTGKKVEESNKKESWGFQSKCPEKWAHVDCETGLVFVWDSTRKDWKRPSKDIIDAAFVALCNLKARSETFM